MQIKTKEFPFFNFSPLCDALFNEQTIYFDIETTGFSAQNTNLYLIGCATRKNDTLCIHQFFADSPSDEKAVIEAFFALLATCDTTITFNGLGFDLPYLKAKCAQLHITECLDSRNNLDIYKEVSRLKHLLKLENCRQKTIEAFLGIAREDRYTGGELISLYHSYVHCHDEKLLSLLLLHNYEDVLAMPKITDILAYGFLFQGEITQITDASVNATTTLDGTQKKDFILRFSLKYPLPKPISCGADGIYLSADGKNAALAVRMTEDTLKHFYENYRDYYYLPAEDTAIHKSVAIYTDKAYRQPAKASNCYTKKYGTFLPQFTQSLVTPHFSFSHKEKNSYFLYDEKMQNDFPLLIRYTAFLLKHLVSCKTEKPIL